MARRSIPEAKNVLSASDGVSHDGFAFQIKRSVDQDRYTCYFFKLAQYRIEIGILRSRNSLCPTGSVNMHC